MPARNSAPMEVLVRLAKMISGMLGGMTGPWMAELTVSAVAKSAR